MKKGKTDITILLDRTGSMKDVQKATIDSFNEFVSEQKKVAGEADLTLIQFDSIDSQERVFSGSVQNTPLLDDTIYIPRGMTPLHDAMGIAITKAGERFSKMDESDRPEYVVFVVLTDGQENSSEEYSQEQIAKMVKTQQDVYKWQFVFMGANQNAVLTAKHYNIPGANAVTYAANNIGTRSVTMSMSENVGQYRATGQSAAMRFTTAQRTCAMGGIPKKKKEKVKK